jgi:hypothetical protein
MVDIRRHALTHLRHDLRHWQSDHHCMYHESSLILTRALTLSNSWARHLGPQAEARENSCYKSSSHPHSNFSHPHST